MDIQEFAFKTNPTKNWDFLSPDLTELILSYLPISSIIKATSVCKLWRSTIHSYSFKTRISNSPRFPWLFFFDQNSSFSDINSHLFAFDPESNYWIKIPNTISNGFLFTTSQTGPVKYSRSKCNSRISGLQQDDIKARLVVEIYNPSIDSWDKDLYPSLPEILRPGNSSKLLSSALFNGKHYVLEIYSSFISSFDFEERSWSNVKTLRPPGVMFSYLISCENGLVLAGLCSVHDDREFNLWRIDEKTLEFQEIGIMPDDLLSGYFNSERDSKFGRLKCVGLGNLVYVFDEECPWNYPVCVCEISDEGKCSWKRVSDFPEPVDKFQRFISFCSTFSLLDVLGN